MSISFTKFQNPEWRDKVNLELRNQLESYATNVYIHQPQGIYVHHEAQLVGGITFQKYSDILWIEGIWVEEKFKRQGIGKSLVNQMLDRSKKDNASNIQLNTYFSEAMNFFQANGFEIVNSIPNWKYDLTCYFMRKYI